MNLQGNAFMSLSPACSQPWLTQVTKGTGTTSWPSWHLTWDTASVWWPAWHNSVPTSAHRPTLLSHKGWDWCSIIWIISKSKDFPTLATIEETLVKTLFAIHPYVELYFGCDFNTHLCADLLASHWNGTLRKKNNGYTVGTQCRVTMCDPKGKSVLHPHNNLLITIKIRFICIPFSVLPAKNLQERAFWRCVITFQYFIFPPIWNNSAVQHFISFKLVSLCLWDFFSFFFFQNI